MVLHSTISYILKNPAYYGHYYVNQYVYDGLERIKMKKPDNEFIYFEIPPIISKDEWDKIQAITNVTKSKGKIYQYQKIIGLEIF